MPLFISGTCATIFYTSEVYPTRISVRFARSLKCRSQKSGSLVPLSVTAAMYTGGFKIGVIILQCGGLLPEQLGQP